MTTDDCGLAIVSGKPIVKLGWNPANFRSSIMDYMDLISWRMNTV